MDVPTGVPAVKEVLQSVKSGVQFISTSLGTKIVSGIRLLMTPAVQYLSVLYRQIVRRYPVEEEIIIP